jgi:homoserine kinase
VSCVSSFPPRLHLKLPATSANLGPGFDTLALALALYLEIDAEPSAEFSIEATGRSTDICSRVEGNLLLQVYRDTVRRWSGSEAVPLALTMRNGIPLGMGCGSSAASRLAGVALASHFGSLGLSRDQILAEASRLEGHPDNAAACWLGGFVASGWDESLPWSATEDKAPGIDPTPVAAISIAPPAAWHALLVLPAVPLATTASRAVLPGQYSRRDTVLNLQRVAVLTAAFAAGRGELLRGATADSVHQPYRGAVCPLLPRLLPLAGSSGILSVTLSGAGPAVLLLLESAEAVPKASTLVQQQVAGYEEAAIAELIDCALAVQAAEVFTQERVNG